MDKKHILIVGAGPGGLTAAMILAHRGFRVTVVEKSDKVGGRNSSIEKGGFRFDVGPTFLMMKFILDEAFELAGRKSSDYLDFIELDPMYKLIFDGFEFEVKKDADALKKQIDSKFPGLGAGYDKFLKKEFKRASRMYPCLQKPYSSFFDMLHPTFIKAIPSFLTPRSLWSVLKGYFREDDLALCFTFQSKYLGMSPWECPGAFGIIPFVEHAYGIFHVTGGLSEISVAMAKVAMEEKVELKLNAEVKELVLDGRKVTGARLKSGEEIKADEVVLNADFAYSMTNLVPGGVLKKYAADRVQEMSYSCSTYMLYLGLDKTYPDLPHHTVIFSKDYKTFVDDIFVRKIVSDDISMYIRNASLTDKTIAPDGCSNIYILVPVANLKGVADWTVERAKMREKVLKTLESRGGMPDIRSHIKVEHEITPNEWKSDYHVHYGATFNLAHTMSQMMYFRPHNKFEELENLYLVGGGTHPGSGLPTIYESGIIGSDMICRKYGRETTTARAIPPLPKT